jgi:hypothetical protein
MRVASVCTVWAAAPFPEQKEEKKRRRKDTVQLYVSECMVVSCATTPTTTRAPTPT